MARELNHVGTRRLGLVRAGAARGPGRLGAEIVHLQLGLRIALVAGVDVEGNHRRAVEGVGQHARAPDRLECGQIRGVLDHLGFEHTREFGRHFEHHGEGQAHQALLINAQRDRHRAPIKERVFDSVRV